jgi:multiple sugar transport system ATP-binding protein
MIAGLEDISSGTLSFNGEVINEVPPDKRDIAMVFQSYALYPHKTVYENIAFGLKMRKYPYPEI